MWRMKIKKPITQYSWFSYSFLSFLLRMTWQMNLVQDIQFSRSGVSVRDGWYVSLDRGQIRCKASSHTTQHKHRNIYVPSGIETTIPVFEYLLLIVYVIQKDKGKVSCMQSGRNMKMTTLHAVSKSIIWGASLHVPQNASMAWHRHSGIFAPLIQPWY
jgi:hypothetical protein